MISLVRGLIRVILAHRIFFMSLAIDIIILVWVIYRARKNRKEKERQKLISKEIKTRHLIERISNPEYLKRQQLEYGRSYPYKVKDGGTPLDSAEMSRSHMVNLSVQTQMLTREYLVPVSDGIMIGRSANNTICVDDPDLSEHQCRIYFKDDMMCLESVSGASTVVRRGSQFIRVRANAIELQSEDIILIGENRIIVNF